MKTYGGVGVEVQLHTFLNPGPWNKFPISTEEEASWVPEQDWMFYPQGIELKSTTCSDSQLLKQSVNSSTPNARILGVA
jgi:hypothetical protein